MSNFKDELQNLFGTVDLYAVLCLEKSASEKDLKRAYYKSSLKYHPDRVGNGASAEETRLSTTRFQALGRVYQILSDEQKRKLYDDSGIIEDETNVDDMLNWMAYWRQLFKKVTLKDVEKFKRSYKGSVEEINDLKLHYTKHEGRFDLICESAFCADSEEDRERIRTLLQKLIDDGELEHSPNFGLEESETQKKRRLRKSQKEAAEAEKMLKEITGKERMEESDLVNAIAKRSADRAVSFFEQLEAKYGGGGSTSGRGGRKTTTTTSKKRKINDNEEGGGGGAEAPAGTPKKKPRKRSAK